MNVVKTQALPGVLNYELLVLPESCLRSAKAHECPYRLSQFSAASRWVCPEKSRRKMKAVCIHCGKAKRGIWTACDSCGHEPSESLDVAQSVLLSDHNMLAEDLSTLAGRIASGEGVQFRGPDVERVAGYIDRTRMGKTWQVEHLVIFVGVLFLIAAIMAVIIRLTHS